MKRPSGVVTSANAYIIVKIMTSYEIQKMDFVSGYWQLMIDHKYADHTAFEFTEGLFLFK